MVSKYDLNDNNLSLTRILKYLKEDFIVTDSDYGDLCVILNKEMATDYTRYKIQEIVEPNRRKISFQ